MIFFLDVNVWTYEHGLVGKKLFVAILHYLCYLKLKYFPPRIDTLLYGVKKGMRTFLLIAYFFIPMNMTHSQLIHEVNLTCPKEEDGKYQLGGWAKTSCDTTVHFHKIFRYNSPPLARMLSMSFL